MSTKASLNEARVSVKEDTLFRMGVANSIIGMFLANDIVLAVYISYISHLAVSLCPTRPD